MTMITLKDNIVIFEVVLYPYIGNLKLFSGGYVCGDHISCSRISPTLYRWF